MEKNTESTEGKDIVKYFLSGLLAAATIDFSTKAMIDSPAYTDHPRDWLWVIFCFAALFMLAWMMRYFNTTPFVTAYGWITGAILVSVVEALTSGFVVSNPFMITAGNEWSVVFNASDVIMIVSFIWIVISVVKELNIGSNLFSQLNKDVSDIRQHVRQKS